MVERSLLQRAVLLECRDAARRRCRFKPDLVSLKVFLRTVASNDGVVRTGLPAPINEELERERPRLRGKLKDSCAVHVSPSMSTPQSSSVRTVTS